MTTSTSWVVTRIRFPAFLKLPSRIEPTPSSLPISPTFFEVPLYPITEVLEITLRPLIPETVEITSSVIPSAKYSSLGSGLKLAKGRTAMRCSSAAGISAPCCSQGSTTLKTSSGSSTFLSSLLPMLTSGNSNLFLTWS